MVNVCSLKDAINKNHQPLDGGVAQVVEHLQT
jgi:hypothetical protein